MQIPSQDETVCDLQPISQKRFTGICQLFFCKSDSQLSVITAVDRARSFADSPLLISNYPEKRLGETQTLMRTRLQPVFPLSKILSGQPKVAVVHRGPQHHLALIPLCLPDVGPYGSTYSTGKENKWFVFLLWSHSLCTYKTSFWRLETYACVEPDISWHVSMECVAFPLKLTFPWVQFYFKSNTDQCWSSALYIVLALPV